MKKLSCPECGRTLMLIESGRLEIKCPRCGAIVKIDYPKVKSKDGRH